jgi:hypothetical protein
METTYNKLNSSTQILMDKLKYYLETPIYFYGSVQRLDFFPNYSDIDIDIFTENEQSVINKLCHFFGMDKRDIKPVIYRTRRNQTVKGFKTKYENIEKNIYIEISIYREKDKETILTEHNRETPLPYIVVLLLVILKSIYYYFGIIDKEYFLYFKKKIIHLFDSTLPIFIDVGFTRPT